MSTVYTANLNMLAPTARNELFNEVMSNAIEIVNEELASLFLKVSINTTKPRNPSDANPDFHLTLTDDTGEEFPISIATPREDDGMQCKKAELLASEIKEKVNSHLLIRKTEELRDRYIISSSGSIYDLSHLKSHVVSIHEWGSLLVNGRKVERLTKEGPLPLGAHDINTYTILRLIEDSDNPNLIHVYDEYNHVRPDSLGLAISVKETGMHSLERPLLTNENKQYLGQYLV